MRTQRRVPRRIQPSIDEPGREEILLIEHETSNEEEQRREFGGYTESELDAALLEAERSDLPSVILRIAVVGLVFYFLARSILAGLPGPFLLLPLLIELLVVFWLGWVMSRTVVDCKAFRRSAGSVGLAVFWTVLAAMLVLAVLAYDGEREALSAARIAPAAESALNTVIEHDLHWAMAAMLGGLVATTVMDVLRWKQRGGVFFWASITTAGFRLGLIIVAGVFAAIPLMLFGGVLVDQTGQDGWVDTLAAQQWAWPIWAVLLLLELGVVLLATFMHRDLIKGAAERSGA